jgi:hypothetical protein
MFDSTIVCLIRLETSPLVSHEALRELKALIDSGQGNSSNVVQAQRQRLFQTEGSDAPRNETTAIPANTTFSASDGDTQVGEPAAGGAVPSIGTPITVVADPCRRRAEDER